MNAHYKTFLYCRNEDSGDKWYECLIPGCLKATSEESGAKSKWYDCLIPGCLKDVQCCSCQISECLNNIKLERAEWGKSRLENLLYLGKIVRWLCCSCYESIKNIPNRLKQAKWRKWDSCRGKYIRTSCSEILFFLLNLVIMAVFPLYDVITDCISASDHFK